MTTALAYLVVTVLALPIAAPFAVALYSTRAMTRPVVPSVNVRAPRVMLVAELLCLAVMEPPLVNTTPLVVNLATFAHNATVPLPAAPAVRMD